VVGFTKWVLRLYITRIMFAWKSRIDDVRSSIVWEDIKRCTTFELRKRGPERGKTNNHSLSDVQTFKLIDELLPPVIIRV